MATTINIITQVEVRGVDNTILIGSKTVPLAITLNADEQILHTKHQLATGTAKEIARFGTADGDDVAAPFKVLVLKPEVDTEICMIGGTTADSSNFAIEAGHICILTSGLTTDYQATYANRLSSGTATQENITKVYALQSAAATASIEVLAAY